MPSGKKLNRANIVLIVADDYRQDAMHGDRCTGPATPVLDRLAAAGTSFSTARIIGGDNKAVLVPSRAALLTGCAPRHALIASQVSEFAQSQRINPQRAQLGEVLGRAGYQTFAVGRWHNDAAALNRKFSDGAALLMASMSPHESPTLHAYDPTEGMPLKRHKRPTDSPPRFLPMRRLISCHVPGPRKNPSFCMWL